MNIGLRLSHSANLKARLELNAVLGLFIGLILINLVNGTIQNLSINEKALSPVILVPGDGGCQLQARFNKPEVVHFFCSKVQQTWETLWLIVTELAPGAVSCFVDNMKLVYNNQTRGTENSPGVEIQIPGFGNTYSVEYLDPYSLTHYFLGYFDAIVNSLVKIGYQRNKTVRGAPFDFRKAPNELGSFYSNLTSLIEESFNTYKMKVTLIAHSMGAPVLHYYFAHKSQEWKDKYIQTVISLSGAWGGSVKPIKIYAVGDNLGYRFLSASSVKELQRSFSSLAFLMPSRSIWRENEVLVQTPSVNYSLSNIEDYFNAIPFRDGFEMYQDTKDLLYNASPPGVEVHCLYGVEVPTIEKIIYKEAKDFPLNPQFLQGDGDGTVNRRSSEFCAQFSNKQKEKVYNVTMPKVDHMSILSNSLTLNYITKYLQNIKLQNLLSKVGGRPWHSNEVPSNMSENKIKNF